MTLDILHFIDNKGGNAEEIRDSQRKRGNSVELVDEIIQMYSEWVKRKVAELFDLTITLNLFSHSVDYEINILRKKVNEVQKEISAKKKVCGYNGKLYNQSDLVVRGQAKENADDLVGKKKEIDAQVEIKKKEAKDFEVEMRQKATTVGNIVGKNVPVSLTEVMALFSLPRTTLNHYSTLQDDNLTLRTWVPKGESEEPPIRENILAHHEVLLRLDAMDLERGAKVAGHRGYYLTNEGLDLNQALIAYALDFLRKKGYKKIMPPFFMNKDQMAKTAQLDQFDEELYKVSLLYLFSILF